MQRNRLLGGLAATTTIIGLLSGAAAVVASPASPLAGLKILISNDDSMQNARPDGGDGRGLYELRRVMCGAGADVVVIAPWAQQSGAGTGGSGHAGTTYSVTKRTAMPAGYETDCAAAPSKGAVYGVCLASVPCGPSTPSASPADTVRLALGGVLAQKAGWAQGPDLVLSGINAGPNIANFINGSGTVGAAIAALDAGVPAVAVNASIDLATFTVKPQTYRDTAGFAARLVGDMWRKDMLNATYAVNVNYPDVDALTSPQPVFAEIGTATFLAFSATSAGTEDIYRINGVICTEPGPLCLPETQRHPDAKLLVQDGRITVGLVAANRTYQGPASIRLRSYLHKGR